MSFEVKHEQRFNYCEEGNGEVIVLLHGLFGALSNFNQLITYFSPRYKIAIPLLPLYNLAVAETTITGMADYIDEFIEHKKYDRVHLLGNSLGGHIAQLYYLRKPQKVKTMTLTGSSGLFENSLGDTYPRKGDYEFVKKKTEETFFDPKTATKALADEVFEIVNNREKVIRMVSMAKSAVRCNLRDEIPNMNLPVCLIWGKDDIITPAFVAEEFRKLLPNAELHILEQCGHAAMMEQPEQFNRILENFLSKN